MDTQGLYSIRMRASEDGRHVSGAERIVPKERVKDTVNALIVRALEKGTRPDKLSMTIDELGQATIGTLTALDIITLDVPDVQTGRETAANVLAMFGVSPETAKRSISVLAAGAAPSGGIMRGAMIIDARTGERLESDQERGVRAARFDWSDEASEEIETRLRSIGLTHFRTKEALALATKVAHAPGIVAELCWSDDPAYTAGYVSSPEAGYVRFPSLKQPGDRIGGRIFFVKHGEFDMTEFKRYLQEQPVLIVKPGACRPVTGKHEALERIRRLFP